MAEYSHSAYLDFVFREQSQWVPAFEKWLQEHPDLDDCTLVGRGISGTVIAVTLSNKTGMNFAIVRKPHDDSHGQKEHALEYSGPWQIKKHVMRYLIVDDFIESGKTVRSILEIMPKDATCMGVIILQGRPLDACKFFPTYILCPDK